MYISNIYSESVVEDKLPTKWRKRVEVFIVDDDGNLILGKGNNGIIMCPGGGLDDDSVKVAAQRECKEEVGIKLKNIKQMNLNPFRVDWYEITKKGIKISDKISSRMKEFRGSETYFCIASFDKNDNSLYGDDNDEMKRVTMSLKDFKNYILKTSNNEFGKPRLEAIEVIEKELLEKGKIQWD
jgi:8-oxo-dGTP pyrophosphatase MutT (NUDIX family)